MEVILFFLKTILWTCGAAAIFFIFIIIKIKFFTPKSVKSSVKIKSSKSEKPKIKFLNRDGDTHDDEWHTYIAGLNHHASKYDIGGFCGYVANDVTNTHDINAMGVYNSFKLLGYIPAKELRDYRLWSNGEAMPCVGFIYVEDGQMRGRVKILKPCNKEFLEIEFSRYLGWVKDNWGEKYLPGTLSMTFETE